MSRKIIISFLLFVLVISLGVLNISCSTNANADNEPKPASLDNYYTKDEIDTMLSEYYMKGVIDTLYYRKSEVDGLVQANKNTIISGSMSLGANSLYWVNGGYADGTEGRSSIISPVNGTLKNLVIKQSDTLNTGSVVVVTVRVNSTNTPLSLQLMSADSTDVKIDTTNIVDVNQGDLISLQLQEIGGIAPDNSWTHASFLFCADL
jgi:hypothetical protein